MKHLTQIVKYTFIVPVVCLFGFGSTLIAQTLTINYDKSQIGFIGSKIGFMDVYGVFQEYSGSIKIDNDVITQIEGTIKVDSVDSKSAKRDINIRGKDLFESKKYPEINFTMTKYEKIDEVNGRVYGTLQMHGVAKDVELDSTLIKQNEAYILTLTGKVDVKKDFEMTSYSMMSNNIRIDVSLYLQESLSQENQDSEPKQPTQESESTSEQTPAQEQIQQE